MTFKSAGELNVSVARGTRVLGTADQPHFMNQLRDETLCLIKSDVYRWNALIACTVTSLIQFFGPSH